MRYVIFNAQGESLGDFGDAQDLNQEAYKDCTQVEVPENDPRITEWRKVRWEKNHPGAPYPRED